MADRKFPTKLMAWHQDRNGSGGREPDYIEIAYSEIESDSFIDHLHRQKLKYKIEEHKPKLKELKRLNWFEKLSFAIPFRTQVSDILVDSIKVTIGIIIGYGLTKLFHM